MMANTRVVISGSTRLEQRGHQRAPQPQRKDEEEHGALVAAPHGRQLEAKGRALLACWAT